MAIPQGTDWRRQILQGVKAPLTPANIRALNAWAQAEGGGATNNPFNTTQSMPGAIPYNTLDSGGHVYKYPTPQAGIQATIQTLKGPIGNYGPIVSALRQGTDPMAVAKAIAGSQWGTGTGVERVLGGSVPPTTTTPTVPVAAPLPNANVPSVPNIKPTQLTPTVAPPPLPVSQLLPSSGGVPMIGRGPGSLFQTLLQSNAAAAALPPAKLNSGARAQGPLGSGRAAAPVTAHTTDQGTPVEIQGRPTKRALQAVKLAEHFMGTPYSWGGGGPSGPSYGVAQGANIKGFDCSSLIQYVWGKQGVDIPRVTYDQWNTGKPVTKGSLKAGDALFFHPGPQGPEHVGMYIGQGKFIEAPHTGATVRISNLHGRDGYMGARRFA